MSAPRLKRSSDFITASLRGRRRNGSMSCIRSSATVTRASLDTMLEQRRGRINQEFRLRAADGHYFWYLLKARPVIGPEGEVIRVIGTLSDITEQKTAQTRLLHDAVNDNLTGLPNRELFFDRLDAALKLSQTDALIRPTVICIDIDRFKHINETIGFSAGDSILLTVARRLGRILKPQGHARAPEQRSIRRCCDLRARDGPYYRHRQCRAPGGLDPGLLRRDRGAAHGFDRSCSVRSAIARQPRRYAQRRRDCGASWQTQRRQPH